jgi:hypothetical protein
MLVTRRSSRARVVRAVACTGGHKPAARRRKRATAMTIQRLDNVGIVVDDLEAAIASRRSETA